MVQITERRNKIIKKILMKDSSRDEGKFILYTNKMERDENKRFPNRSPQGIMIFKDRDLGSQIWNNIDSIIKKLGLEDIKNKNLREIKKISKNKKENEKSVVKYINNLLK